MITQASTADRVAHGVEAVAGPGLSAMTVTNSGPATTPHTSNARVNRSARASTTGRASLARCRLTGDILPSRSVGTPVTAGC